MNITTEYSLEVLTQEARPLLAPLRNCTALPEARKALRKSVARLREECRASGDGQLTACRIRSRDCAQAFRQVLSERGEEKAGFSVAQALWDIARERPRPDLEVGFFAEMIHWVEGLRGNASYQLFPDAGPKTAGKDLNGREAALARSDHLDRIWSEIETRISGYGNGLDHQTRRRRKARRERIVATLGGKPGDWWDWRWQVKNLIKDEQSLARLAQLSPEEETGIRRARAAGLPFGLTPYYASLFEENGGHVDRAIRAQVLPPNDYVDRMLEYRETGEQSCDFMLESDTSPIDLVTRRYPAVAIFKPYKTCPQICVYCQRNWEIQQAMAPGALASEEEIDGAIEWIRAHPAVREVLVTGGDPLILEDRIIGQILEKVASIEHVDMIRIGSRIPVTLPMRITGELASLLGSFRIPGRRDVALVTHVEHPLEITTSLVLAVDRLKRAGLSVYNQHVYTAFVSRRFETLLLRLMLRKASIDPYYTFLPKGKQETDLYRVPLARLLQEQKEEARLVPGLRRTDEAVYNVPSLGKNYLRARQYRSLLAVMPDGSRVYEFFPWETNIVDCGTYVGSDKPILDYLGEMEAMGEDPADYQSIWFYF